MKKIYIYIIILWLYQFVGIGVHAQTFLDSNVITYDTTYTEDSYSDYEAPEQEDFDEYQSYLDEGQKQTPSRYEPRQFDEAEWNKLAKQKEFTYKHVKETKEKIKKQTQTKSNNKLFDLLAIILIAVILILAIYLMMGKYYFSKSDKKISYEVDDMDDNITITGNWEKQVADALAKNNYRLAFRLRFVQSLHALSDKQLINLHKEKTNYDYINEIGRTEIKKGFQVLVRYFDYIWYGMFDLNKTQYLAIEQDILHFQDKLNQI